MRYFIAYRLGLEYKSEFYANRSYFFLIKHKLFYCACAAQLGHGKTGMGEESIGFGVNLAIRRLLNLTI